MLNFLAWKPGKKVVHIEEAPYKEEPKEEEKKVDCPLGEIECPIPSEIEL